ncbi:MAG TPA: M1 family metallopeptidase, partial [Chitinophagaceae bacterium]|nr:M1 family metallopeptidase [Chitinophagaceae bacterium]
MKKSICTFFTAMAFCCTFGQYWQQQVDYRIDVSLNDKDHVLDGFEKITYTNNSPDTLTFIWFHLWPNAFKNDKTAFTQQQLLNGDTKFYFSSKEQKGYINRLSFKVNGQTARTEDHPEHIDIIKLVLPSALLPGKQVVITTPFHVKLPYNFSRGGHRGLSYQVTQWYPKPAVYDADGWHPMPYLDQGEFYSEFGSFDVKITLPKSYVVAATGELQNEDEKTWLLTRGSAASDVGSKKKQTATSTARTPPSKTVKKSVKKPAAPMSKEETITAEAKTLHYMQNNVHDFAWFADKNFIVNHDTCSLPSGRVIEVYTYFNPEHKKIWKNSTQLSKDAIQFYSSEVGEYPYNIVSAVQGPQNFGGGMEYPTITVIAPVEDEKSLDIVLAHEIGHNWFYGILASNERKHPWLDEGVNSFYENKYKKAKYGSTSNAEDLLLQTKAVQHQDQPIETPSESFSLTNYILVAYHKTAKWLQLMEQETGEQQFRKAMQNYYNTWKFKHPQPQDFRNALAPALGEKAQSYFSHLNSKGSSPAEEKRTWSVVSPFSLKKYVDAPTKNLLLLSPLIGLNSYDKFM